MFRQPHINYRLFSVVTLVFLEIILLSLLFDAQAIGGHGLIVELLSEAGNILRWIIASAAVLVLCLSSNFRTRSSVLFGSRSSLSVLATFCMHLALFLVFVHLTFILFEKTQNYTLFLGYAWILVAGAVGGSLALMIADLKSWRAFIIAERKSIAIAATGGILIILLGTISRQLWGSMTEFTLGSTKLLLQIFYNDVIFSASESKLGLESFWVTIAPSCSGVEGIVLACATVLIYLFLSKEYLRYPHALILLPLAAIISIVLNLVRIAALIILGAEFSPELAVGGFHSIAGWIASILVALLIIFVFSNWSWIQKDNKGIPDITRRAADSAVAIAILIPFVMFTGLSLISGIFIDEFDYLYPGKIVLVVFALGYFWNTYQLSKPQNLLESIAIGAIVAILWIILIPGNNPKNMEFFQALNSLPAWAVSFWIFFRMAGFLVVAPILEEMVFRGYLISRLSGQNIEINTKINFSLASLIISSVLFGLLHDAWLVGTIAGILFAYSRFRSRVITDPIVAHGTANIFVAVWASRTGNWSLI